MPMTFKNLFPKSKNNVNMNDVIKKTIKDSLRILLRERPEVRIAKIGIKAIGSIAIKAFKTF